MTPKIILTRDDVRKAAENLTHAAIGASIGLSREAVTHTLGGRRKHPGTQYAIATFLHLNPDLIDWNER